MIEDFSKVFDSISKIKIVDLLHQRGGHLNITQITLQTKTNHKRVSMYLNELEQDGIVQVKIFGRIKIISFNQQNLQTRRLLLFLNTWYESPINYNGLRPSIDR